MHELLERAEKLEAEKVNLSLYNVEQEKIWTKFKESDIINKENHIHYI